MPTALLAPSRDFEPSLSNHARRGIARAIAGAWLAIFAFNILLSQLAGWDGMLAVRLALSTLCGFAISMSLHWFMLRRSHGGAATFAETLAITLSAGLLLWLIDTSIQAATAPVRGPSWPWSQFMRLRLNLVYFSALFVLQGAGARLLFTQIALEARERQLLGARLSALRFQLNPHFIFNTLNAISTLCAEGGGKQAEEMLSRLSDFLRASLSSEPTDLVTLSQEIDLVQAYLEIEAVRFEDRLDVRYAIDPGLADALVPSLILQPLIENAVKYGVAPSKRPVTVRIEATAENGNLILIVKDDGRQRSEPDEGAGTGVGLANVAARLDTLYGRASRIEAVRREVGFTAVVRLPMRRPGRD